MAESTGARPAALADPQSVAQASPPAGCGSVPLPVRDRATYRGETPLEPAAGTAALRSKDVIGCGYEYEKLTNAEGKGGGEFYTPQCVVQVFVAMLEPNKGRAFAPCCGSGGMEEKLKELVEIGAKVYATA